MSGTAARWQPPGPALLFCPGDRPDRFAKAAAAADAVILDLEDGVAPGDRPAARRAIAESRLDPAHTVVRVNPSGTPDHAPDLDAVARSPYAAVMLAKTETADQVRALAPLAVIALCETPAAILAAAQIASAADAVMWGSEDLIAGLGGRSSRHGDGSFREVVALARSTVLLAAGAAGIPAIDTVQVDLAGLAVLQRQAEDAAASGFAALGCVHPSQVPVVRSAFRPTEDEVSWARRVLEAAQANGGAFRLDGQMIDGPLIRHAEQVMSRAGRD
ncbi:MAG TPA: CoA ester lyase [Mycobacteriales bacterium]|nr:CoA ester lyase [Mycobacteriales bacterium]